MRHIKKYGNRRLYCTQSSAYVNLAQLSEFVRAGETLKVTEAKTGEDLTRGVLLQLLMEQQGSDLIPMGLLHRLLRFQLDAPLHKTALQQLSMGLTVLDQQLAQAESQWPWLQPGGHPTSTAEPDKTGPAAETVEPPTPDADPELQALRQRLADLETRLRR